MITWFTLQLESEAHNANAKFHSKARDTQMFTFHHYNVSKFTKLPSPYKCYISTAFSMFTSADPVELQLYW